MPGDSLLFSIGVASGASGVNVYALAAILMCAAIIGDNVGYFLGRHAGPRIFSRPESLFFHPDHLSRTRVFYQTYGARAVIYARFIPVIRTCTPFISGVAHMRYARFLLFSLFGGALWIAFMTTLGYQLGHVDLVRRNFEKFVLGIIFLSLLPAILEALKAWRHRPPPSLCLKLCDTIGIGATAFAAITLPAQASAFRVVRRWRLYHCKRRRLLGAALSSPS